MLCSYFIKTFLFWKFENTDTAFWRAENFRDCIMFLLTEFRQCIQDGILRHYFFPTFNLLSIKLTRDAQKELLQLFGIIAQNDIRIFKECKTLRQVWSHFISTDDQYTIRKMMNIVRNDECTMRYATGLLGYLIHTFKKVLLQTPASLFELPLTSYAFRYCAWISNISTLQPFSTNLNMYKLHRHANNDILSIDISTCTLWYAMVLLMKANYTACLRTINDVFSRIPPYALYMSKGMLLSSNEF